MSISFPIAIISVFIHDPEERAWLKDYCFQLCHETIWCGYERALCLRALWNSQASGRKRPIISMPGRADVTWDWKPRMGLKVGVIYEDLETGTPSCDFYIVDGQSSSSEQAPLSQASGKPQT